MAKHGGGRGRAKRRRCAFVVLEECGNVPAPCQTSLKGVRPHSAGVGKPAKDGAHTGVRGRSCIGPSAGMCARKEKEKIQKRSVVLDGYITRFSLSYDPPTHSSNLTHPFSPPHLLPLKLQ
ncbi:hypothetical protein ATANTOWER_027164 [Ataeniobius toweri]|uniref:Uncharacterized protein n=1 Tax=Ataeniobius toweri TaxID=208326 RepID=A0ABU7BUC3_9TELE|nr:hypothetical protein [Ataeniobius toweri]